MTTMTAPAPDRRAPRPSSGAPGEPLRFAGLRVGVVGLGVEGIDIVRFLHAERAAEIVVSERRPIAELRSQIRALDGIPFAIEAGGNHRAWRRGSMCCSPVRACPTTCRCWPPRAPPACRSRR